MKHYLPLSHLCLISLFFCGCDSPLLVDASIADATFIDTHNDSATDGGSDSGDDAGIDSSVPSRFAPVDIRMWNTPYTGLTPVQLSVSIAGSGSIEYISADIGGATSCNSGPGSAAIDGNLQTVAAPQPLGGGNWGVLIDLNNSAFAWTSDRCSVPAGAAGSLSVEFTHILGGVIYATVEANESTCDAYCVGGHGSICRESCLRNGALRGQTTISDTDVLFAFLRGDGPSVIVRFE